jgi:hypothetical protein
MTVSLREEELVEFGSSKATAKPHLSSSSGSSHSLILNTPMNIERIIWGLPGGRTELGSREHIRSRWFACAGYLGLVR